MGGKRIIIGTVLLAFVCISSCAAKDHDLNSETVSMTKDVFAMDTFMNMKAYGANAGKALDKAEERILQLEKELSVNDEQSDIWAIDHSFGDEVNVCDDTAVIINKAIEIGDRSGGALDITLFPVLKEWGFTTGNYKVPDDDTIGELLSYVDYRKINLNGNIVSLPEKAELDLGALAKGYTGDEIMKIMSEEGVSSAIVSLGGNVQALGSKPDGSDWKIAVRDPFSPEQDMCMIEVSDKAVITSGNYERCFTADDGKVYWHILDPSDGYPADNGLVSVTVIGDSGIDCDALSTALFVAGYDKAVDFLRSENGYELILVTDDKKLYYSEGLSECFTDLSDMGAEVIDLD
ncbi:FAD:protein FMN transferase [uncultured Ruminococcus sp.]|uniref:FAD:protein FMN transferase n=1 Tax=uncultured Ruminococcus sp. TaxID=165186 RepID=UPI00262AE0A1|nr:FAD:protein FMN transferase [uncultured Ruminococcus sp.]